MTANVTNVCHKPRSAWYRQCRLLRRTEEGTAEQITWLPERFAVLGKYLRLKDPATKEWVNGWRVASASRRVAGDIVEAMSREWVQHRNRTDI